MKFIILKNDLLLRQSRVFSGVVYRLRQNQLFRKILRSLNNLRLERLKTYNEKTFCPLPWMHISANTEGKGRVCCEGFETLKQGSQDSLWKNANGLHSYFNQDGYKKIRREMMQGRRPSHCVHCFNQEDHGVQSLRQMFFHQYKTQTLSFLKNTDPDGSINRPRILYADMALGNRCNLKCRMCHPFASHSLAKDWEKMGRLSDFDKKTTQILLRDKWYASAGFFNLLKEALPTLESLFFTGGEPLLIKEHIPFLEMIVKEGHAHHIELRYNSNQTALPEKIKDLWMRFKAVAFNCSVEAFGDLNDYIRHPSKWSAQEKNIYQLDDLSEKHPHISIFIHTTLQAYNVLRIPEFLSYLKEAGFKRLYRFPHFIWVKSPAWCCPNVYPEQIRADIADKILESIERHKDFFLSYNDGKHQKYSQEKIKLLAGFSEMIRSDFGGEGNFRKFVQETRAYDSLRGQSVIQVLPELKRFFVSSESPA